MPRIYALLSGWRWAIFSLGERDAKKNVPQILRDLVFIWQGWQDLNPQPTDLESATLPIELHPCFVTRLILYDIILLLSILTKR